MWGAEVGTVSTLTDHRPGNRGSSGGPVSGPPFSQVLCWSKVDRGVVIPGDSWSAG